MDFDDVGAIRGGGEINGIAPSLDNEVTSLGIRDDQHRLQFGINPCGCAVDDDALILLRLERIVIDRSERA